MEAVLEKKPKRDKAKSLEYVHAFRERQKQLGMPKEWHDLPKSVGLEEEVRWVQSNFMACVKEDPKSSKVKLQWGHPMVSRPPSSGACALMRWASRNQNGFFKDLLPRTVGKSETSDRELEEGERRDIVDVERVLESLMEEASLS